MLARMPREAAQTRDITGGLPRVAELFEARKPKENAIIAKISGKVSFEKDYKAKRKIAIIPDDGSEPVEYLVPEVQGHRRAGRRSTSSAATTSSAARPIRMTSWKSLGVVALAEYLVSEIQEVYRLQGVKINDKHIEVIVRQMLQKVEITDGGDTDAPGRRAGRPRGDGRDQRQAGEEAEACRRQAGAARHHQGAACRPAASSRPRPSRKRPGC